MSISDFLIDSLGDEVYGQANYYFWVRTVIDAMDLLGPASDPGMERLSRLLLDYYSGADIDSGVIDGIRHEIMRLGFDYTSRRSTPLDLKYRCIWNLADSRERGKECDGFQYGVVTAFDNINLGNDKDQALIALVRANAVKYGVDLHEPPVNIAYPPASAGQPAV